MSHADEVKQFYDRLASNYHLIFEDWDASVKRQAATLGAILERECGAPSALRILDCACGSGTQTLGLACLGFTVTACDLSLASGERTRVEAAKRRLNVHLFVADMLDLTEIPERDFDAVTCMDNVLPHFKSGEELFKAASQIGSASVITSATLTSAAVIRSASADIDTLIEAGARIDAIGDLGNTPLHHAASRGLSEIVHQLLRYGAAPNISNEFGQRPRLLD